MPDNPVVPGRVPPTPARIAVRSFGDTAAEYEAARSHAIIVDRTDRALIRVFGRDPVKMVQGLVTNDVQSLAEGASVDAALLTPKGRMLAEVRVIRHQSDVLIECDAAAATNVTDTLARYVPPLFARSENVSEKLAVLGIYGPEAGNVLDRLALPADVLTIPSDYTGERGFDLIVEASTLVALQNASAQAGALRAGHAVLDVLRIEAGSPRWGAELNEDVIPIEAGLTNRLISTTKGCYTGQEVIIRILHRGHVNRYLRGLLLGDAPTPSRGQELFAEGSSKPIGQVTSACFSPRLQQAIALAYVRREVEPDALVHIGSESGPPARVVALPFPIANPQATGR